MKKKTFSDHLRETGKLKLLQVARIRVPSKLQNNPEAEQAAFVLTQARTFLSEEVIAEALKLTGIPRAERAVRVVDADLGIVEAEANGEIVRASSNPFQEAGLHYLPPDELVVTTPSVRPTEPAWVSLPATPEPPTPVRAEPVPEQTPHEDGYRPPVDLTLLIPEDVLPPAQAEEPPHAAPAAAPLSATSWEPTAPEADPRVPAAPPAPALSGAPHTTPAAGRHRSPAARASHAGTAAVLTPEPELPAPIVTAAPEETSDPLRGFQDPPGAAPRPTRDRPRERRITFGEALIQLGFGDVQTYEINDPRLEHTLLKHGRITEEQALRGIALSRHLEFIDALQHPPSKDVLHLLDEATCSQNRVFPYRLEEGVFTVLTDTPQREVLLRTTVAERSGQPRVELALTTSTVLDRLIRDAYTAHATFRDLAQEVEQQGKAEVELGGEDNAVKRYVRDIITTAVARRASDVHFEPTEAGLQVRHRVDKRLRLATTETVNKDGMGNVIRVLKLMAHMDVGNNREPQDGRILLTLGTGRINLRASSMPLAEGREKIVLRILREASEIPEIEQLSMHPRTLALFEKLIAQPDGMILVTGPTGSGKSFTLYSALKRIAREDNNVQTLEDPIEYQLPGINQAQINDDVEFTFQRALRTALRQDPDVILVGEIRDQDTAKVAVAAANTGHLLLSTLHTNDAPSAIQRLRNNGIEDFNIAPALRAVLAQRLVPRVCPHCSQPTTLPDAVQAQLKRARLSVTDQSRKANPAGCSKCDRGRDGLIPVHELLVVDTAMREQISAGATVDELRSLALSRGMLDLLTDGYVKAAAGLMDLDDLKFVVTADKDLSYSPA